jgi:hypothetical protein
VVGRRRGERRYLSSRYDDLFMEVAGDVSVTILSQNWWAIFGDQGPTHYLSSTYACLSRELC